MHQKQEEDEDEEEMKMIMPACVPVVMVRNRSWPAVSQICSLMRFPSNSIVLILKSILFNQVRDIKSVCVPLARIRGMCPQKKDVDCVITSALPSI